MREREPSRGALALLALALAGAALVAYGRVGGFAFVSYDDPDYVLANPWVRGGLTWDGVRWAFTQAHASNWHPLTWFSHMLDVELFELAPGGHHWSSALLHALGSALCFLALRALTRRTGPSWFAAALFALHPLRVESVAWVSERKDVLAGVCFFLTLLAYARYARAPSAGRYLAVLLAFALGLLAKPMLVTLPFVLLLLDAWPLERVASGPGSARSLAVLALEKLPLLALSGLSVAATLWSQRQGGSIYPLAAIPLDARLANAPVAVARYLAHFVWPSGLSYFYPHPALLDPGRPAWTPGALAALAGLVAFGAAAVGLRKRSPAFALGVAWFLGMLVPVIGLVQVGEQALADRYAYLPLVGVELALAFGLAGWAARHARVSRALAGAALAALALLTWRQSATWRDSAALYGHALALEPRNYAALVGLANVENEAGAFDSARIRYEAALAQRPDYAPALYSYGLLEQEHGDPEHAIALYRRALASLPGLAAAHLNLGGLLARRGDVVDAAVEFEAVLALAPEHPDAHFNLAQLLLANGRAEEAFPHLEAATRARPDFGAAWELLALAEEARGRHAQARAAFEAAVREPGRARAETQLAWLLATASEAELRDGARALEHAREAVRLTQRGDPAALEALAAALAEQGELARAAEVQDEALALLAARQPDGRPNPALAAARTRLEGYRAGEPFRHRH